MKHYIYRFVLSALIYGISETCADMFFVIPNQVVSLTIFLPPMLGLMWGSVAAAGVCVGGLIATPGFRELLALNGHIADIYPFLRVMVWLFVASYLPYVLWHKWQPSADGQSFLLTTETLQKFLWILFVTFGVTSIFRAVTASAHELAMVTGWFGFVKHNVILSYMTVCFMNDFLIAVFCDLILFFLLVSKGYLSKNSAENPDKSPDTPNEQMTEEEKKTLIIASITYLIFPLLVAYLDVYQIYGMDNLSTWMSFVSECLFTMDAYIVLVSYLLLRYRRSIMLEIVFLVTITVFVSAAVLGWGSSLAMAGMVRNYVDNSLHAMGVICRERLERTFFCMRQAVNGMENQAINSVESYDRLVNDAAYRENYLANMQQSFDSIVMDIDGCLAYYLRLAPEIAGSKGGFSRVRTDRRWEGALAPFVNREPVDLSRYAPDDTKRASWYYTPIKNKCATWIEPYVDSEVDSYVISYVSPIFVEGKSVGVIGVDIDFNFITQELRRMSIYDYGYVYITNRNNIVLYHKDRFQGSEFQHNPEFRELEFYLGNGMWLGIATPLSKVYDARNRILMHLVTAILIVAMLVSLGSIVLVSRAIRPLAGMTEAAKRIASGDLNVKLSYDSGNELGLLVRSIREMATKLEGYVYRDKLTGLRNAAAYMSKAAELEAQRQAGSNLAYGIVLFDVNFLKKVNDNYGHQAGNQLIRHASRAICRVFRHSPVYRVGGDEFVAILQQRDYENREELLKVFDKKIAEESFKIGNETINISVARGLAVYKEGMAFSDVTKSADIMMYTHKASIKAKFGEEVR